MKTPCFSQKKHSRFSIKLILIKQIKKTEISDTFYLILIDVLTPHHDKKQITKYFLFSHFITFKKHLVNY